MVVHPAPGNPDNTLVNALLFHCHDLSGIGGVLRPGIVHEAGQKNTSGLIVVAKSDEAHRKLSAQFEKHDVHKIYWALVWETSKAKAVKSFYPWGVIRWTARRCPRKAGMARTRSTLWKKVANVTARQRCSICEDQNRTDASDSRTFVRAGLSRHRRCCLRQCV